MYGLVNRAIEQLVVSKFGEELWQEILQRAGIPDEVFLSMESYPDEVTTRLVDAASAVLELPPEAILRAFGQYWTSYTIEQGYGELLTVCGKDLKSFLLNLGSLHTRVQATLPHLRAPTFRCEELGDGVLLLHYQSSRQGFAPMVHGLLEGLCERFGEAAEVSQVQVAERGQHDVFRVALSDGPLPNPSA